MSHQLSQMSQISSAVNAQKQNNYNAVVIKHQVIYEIIVALGEYMYKMERNYNLPLIFDSVMSEFLPKIQEKPVYR